MIPVLYEKNETRFLNYGLGEIDFTFVDVERERNGIYTFYGEYPSDGRLANELIEERQIKSDAGKRTKWQTFVIDRVNRKAKDVIKVYGVHVTQSTATMALTPVVGVTNADAYGALLTWKANLKGNRSFDVWSDITTQGSTTWKAQTVKNARQALGGVSGSILDVWGGEYEFDNNLIRLHKQMGRNTPTTIEYGRNIRNAEVDKQITSTITSIIPYAVTYDVDANDENYTWLDEVVIHGPHRDKWAYDRVIPVDFSAEFDIDDEPTQERLRRLGESYVARNNVGVPRTKITLEMVDLANTLDYKDVGIIEEVELCDILPVYYSDLGITDTQAKISGTRYNPMIEEYITVSIGVVGDGFSATIRNPLQDEIDRVQQNSEAIGNRVPYLINALGNRVWYVPPYSDYEHKEGDVWFEKNGNYHRIHIWDGQRWELVLDTEAVNDAFEEIEQEQGRLQENIQATESKAQQAIEDAAVAQVTAETAQGTAETAQSSADTAKERADDAMGYAQGIVENKGSLLGLDSIQQAIEDIENPSSETWSNIINIESGYLYTYNQQRDSQLLSSAQSQTAGQITQALSDYTTTSELDGEVVRLLSTESTQTAGYLNTVLNDYMSDIDLSGYVTETSLQQRNYLTAESAEQTFVKSVSLDGEITDLLSNDTTQTAGYIDNVLSNYAKSTDLNGYVTETLLEQRNYLTASQAVQTFVQTEMLDGEIVSVLSSGTSQTAQYIQDYVIGEDYISEVIQTSDLVQSEIKRIVPVPTEAEIIALAEATQLDRADIEAMFEDGFLTGEDIQTIADMAGITAEQAQIIVTGILSNQLVQQYETVEAEVVLYEHTNNKLAQNDGTFNWVDYTFDFPLEEGESYPFSFRYPVDFNAIPFVIRTVGSGGVEGSNIHEGLYVVSTQDEQRGWARGIITPNRKVDAGAIVRFKFTDSRTGSFQGIQDFNFKGNKEIQVPVVSENNGVIANRITQTQNAIDIGLFGEEGALTRIYAGEEGLYLKGENIVLDGKVSMEQAFIRNLVASDITANTIASVSATFTNLISTNIDAQSITTNTLTALRARIMGTYTYVDISGTGIGINRNDGNRSIELNQNGMEVYRTGGSSVGRVGGANDGSNNYFGIMHIGAHRMNAVALSSKKNGTNNDWVRSLWVDGSGGQIKVGEPIMSGESGYGFTVDAITISNYGTGLALRSSTNPNVGIAFLPNGVWWRNQSHAWRNISDWATGN